MQKRGCERWLGVLCAVASVSLLFQLASPSAAWAAPRKKKGKAAAAQQAAEEPEPEPVAAPSSSEGASVDDMMENSAKSKSVQQRHADTEAASRAESESEATEKVGQPDAWERPPAEDEKPKKKKVAAIEEVKKGDGNNMEIAVMAGYGFGTTKFFSDDPYGFGFGLRGLYELESHITFGLGVEYFIGNSDIGTTRIGGAAPGAQVSHKANYWVAQAELGYNWWLADNRVILRPSVWVGLAWGVQDPPLDLAGSGVETAGIIAPGLNLNYLLGGGPWYLGAEGRINLIIGQGTSGILLFANFGRRF